MRHRKLLALAPFFLLPLAALAPTSAVADGNADAERAGHARVLAGVQQHEEDDPDGEDDLKDAENRVEHGGRLG